MSDVKHTPGPWKWHKRQSDRGRVIELIHPHRGHLIVMDFVRLGMQRGTFRLSTWEGQERGNMGGIMCPAHEIDIEKHPDARLIAAAPDLLAALIGCVEHMEHSTPQGRAAWTAAHAAIAKAKGGAA